MNKSTGVPLFSTPCRCEECHDPLERRLPLAIQNDIHNYDRAHLKPPPDFSVRKGDYEFEEIPVSQIIEDLMLFVHYWSQRERSLSVRLTMNLLKRKLSELQWAYYAESQFIKIKD